MSRRPAATRWQRLLALLGLLLVLTGAGSAIAQAAPRPAATKAATATPTATATPKPKGPPKKVVTNSGPNCSGLVGPGLKSCKSGWTEVCQPPNAQNVETCTWVNAGSGGSGADCSVLQGTPQTYCKQGETTGSGNTGWLGDLTGSCKSPPTPEEPTDGLMGWFVTKPASPPAFVDPSSADADQTIYQQYGYAGLSWDVYDLGCGGALIRDQNAGVDTWVADKTYTVSKFGVGLSNSLHTWATTDGALDPLDPLIAQASKAVGAAVYTPWITVSMLILGCVIIFGARRRDLPGTVTSIGWALLVITLATISLQQPLQTGHAADSIISSTVGQIDAQFNGTPGTTSPGTAEADMMTTSVLYQNWLRGELGDPSSATAKTYGMLLLDSQALSWAQSEQSPAVQAQIINAKEAEFMGVAAAIQKSDPDAYAHLTGHSASRMGASSAAFMSAAATTPFTDLGSLIVVLAELVIRLVVVFFPILALIGLHRRTSGVVRTGLNTIAAAIVNAPLFAVLGGLEILSVREIMGGTDTALPQWIQILLLAMITVVMWRISKPFRKLGAMVSPNRNFIGEGLEGISQTRNKILGAATSRFSPQNRMLRRIYRGTAAGGGAAGGAAAGAAGRPGPGAGPEALPLTWGAEEEPWEVPAGYTQPRPPGATATVPAPRGGRVLAGVGGATGPGAGQGLPEAAPEPLYESPFDQTGSGPAWSDDAASPAAPPESEGPAWPQEKAPPAPSSSAATSAPGGEQTVTRTVPQRPGGGGSDAPYFQPGATAGPAVVETSGYRGDDERPVYVAYRPPEQPAGGPPPAPPTTGTGTPPARPRPAGQPPSAPPPAPPGGYLPEAETGFGEGYPYE